MSKKERFKTIASVVTRKELGRRWPFGRKVGASMDQVTVYKCVGGNLEVPVLYVSVGMEDFALNGPSHRFLHEVYKIRGHERASFDLFDRQIVRRGVSIEAVIEIALSL